MNFPKTFYLENVQFFNFIFYFVFYYVLFSICQLHVLFCFSPLRLGNCALLLSCFLIGVTFEFSATDSYVVCTKVKFVKIHIAMHTLYSLHVIGAFKIKQETLICYLVLKAARFWNSCRCCSKQPWCVFNRIRFQNTCTGKLFCSAYKCWDRADNVHQSNPALCNCELIWNPLWQS